MKLITKHIMTLAALLFAGASMSNFTASAADHGKLPYEFNYGGKVYKGFEGVIDGTLSVKVVYAEHPDFDEKEYTVWFENVGNSPSKVLKDVYAVKTEFKGSSPVLRGCLGDHDNFYKLYEKDLLKEEVKFTSTEGRATHIVFPYFDLVHGNMGTRIALGWAGTWEAKFSAKGNKTTLTAQTNLGLETVLMPGEKIRTGLVAMLDYEGRDEHVSVNKWRAWFMKYNLPKADAQGNDIKPLWSIGFDGDTGLPNSDGSISETYFTWPRTLAKLQRENYLPDYRWFDAGWYCDANGKTVLSDWWGTVGTWELDKVKWPDNTFRESNEACHKLGMKVLMWFEPERVTRKDFDALVKNYGYKEEWGVKTGTSCVTSNIGDPECLKWTLDRILKVLDENEVDMYREDNNSDPAAAWLILDSRDEAKYGCTRKGINENKCIQGHYALWDGIIEFCRQHGKCTFVDSCASGGGRNDLESMRRGFPMMRSDYDRTTIAMRLSQSSGLNKWIPFHGSTTKETAQQLQQMSAVPDLYITRASLLPVWNSGGAFTHNINLNFDEFRRNLKVWKDAKDLLVKDFYHLSEWHGPEDTSGWTVFAYCDPEQGKAILTAFRQETCTQAEYKVGLPFAKAGKSYKLTDADSGRSFVAEGSELAAGITLKLDQPRSSLLLNIIEQ